MSRTPNDVRRVLHVMRMSGVSGAENHLLELTEQLRACGWPCDVLIPSPDPRTVKTFAEHLREHCGQVRVFRMTADLSPQLVLHLIHLLRDGSYSVVHSHLVHADWHVAAASIRAPRVAIVSTKHNHDPFRQRAPVRVLEQIASKRADAVVAISRSLASFTSEWSGVNATTVYYGHRSDDPPRTTLPQPARLLAVGRLEPQKGYETLIRAMTHVANALPNAHLRIAGDGKQRGQLEELVRQLDLEAHVALLGQRDDIRELMASSTALVHAARWEGFGLVLLEAMQASLPIVATRTGAIPEVVADGSTGVLVAPDDPDELGAALVDLLSDQARCLRLGLAGKHRLEARFTPIAMAKQTAAVYEAATQHRRDRSRPGH